MFLLLLHGSSRFDGFGDDGGRAAKSLRPKFNAFVSHVTTHTGQQLPPVDVSASYSSSRTVLITK